MKHTVYIGSYSQPIAMGDGSVLQGQGVGIQRYCFDDETGGFSPLDATPSPNASFFCFSPDGSRLYAANETDRFNGQPGGGVSAFAVEPGGLRFLNSQPTGGTSPCHLLLDTAGKLLFVANYGSGSLAVFRLGADGALAERTQLLQHSGTGPDPIRQEGPHIHCSLWDAATDILYLTDLGLDSVEAHSIDREQGLLAPLPTGGYTAPAGHGPRSLLASADGAVLYLSNELANSITVLRCQGGGLAAVQELSTLPPDFSGVSILSEPVLSADGRWLYAGNRGHDSIAVLRVLPDGLLESACWAPTHGHTPRSYARAGGWLLAGNQDSGSLTFFRAEADGGLRFDRTETVPTPACVRARSEREQ